MSSYEHYKSWVIKSYVIKNLNTHIQRYRIKEYNIRIMENNELASLNKQTSIPLVPKWLLIKLIVPEWLLMKLIVPE